MIWESRPGSVDGNWLQWKFMHNFMITFEYLIYIQYNIIIKYESMLYKFYFFDIFKILHLIPKSFFIKKYVFWSEKVRMEEQKEEKNHQTHTKTKLSLSSNSSKKTFPRKNEIFKIFTKKTSKFKIDQNLFNTIL